MAEQTFESVWDALEDTPNEAENMKIKSDLMMEITELIKKNGWTQETAAQRCGVTLPRIRELLHGKINYFSFDALLNIINSLGCRVRVAIEA